MTPFGFTPDESSDGSDENSNQPLDFTAMMNQMQEQIREQFQKLGIDPNSLTAQLPGFGPGLGLGIGSQAETSLEALPKNIVRDTAKNFVNAHGSTPIGANDVSRIEAALAIAELWLNEGTFFPATQSSLALGKATLARTDWVNSTLAGWQKIVEPLAIGLAAALTELLAQATQVVQGAEESAEESAEERAMPIPVTAIAGLLRTFIGSLIATQLGQAIGGLCATVTGVHDVGLPLLDPAQPALVPQNIDEWAKELDIPIEEIRIFHALRECAVARLFANSPWLVSYIRGAISEYGKGIRIDIAAIQRQAEEAFEAASASGEIDPMNPESFSIALSQGIFTPEESPTQRAALIKLETALALIDGWTEEVVSQSAGDRLPNIAALSETLRRGRATSAPTAQLFANLFGLSVSPRLAREAAKFWARIREISDIEIRDRIWSGILPTAQDLLSPESYLQSITIPDDLSGL